MAFLRLLPELWALYQQLGEAVFKARIASITDEIKDANSTEAKDAAAKKLADFL